MKYIPLDDVTSIISNYSEEDMAYQIYSLKPIDLSIIYEMIQENLEYPENDHNLGYRSSLKELKERLSLTK